MVILSILLKKVNNTNDLLFINISPKEKEIVRKANRGKGEAGHANYKIPLIPKIMRDEEELL